MRISIHKTVVLFDVVQIQLVTFSLSHLEHIGNDKEIGKDLPLLSHCKQTNDPGEAQHWDKDDGGFQQIPVTKIFTASIHLH